MSRWLLTEADLEALELGAALLGTGGVGNTYIGNCVYRQLRTREELRRGNRVAIVTLDELADDGCYGHCGDQGSSSACLPADGSST